MATLPVAMRHSRAFDIVAQPEAVAEIEFLEWTGEDHLRHTRFIRLRDDKNLVRWYRNIVACFLLLLSVAQEI
jgi:ATP-dependent DNA ligase